MRTGTNISPTDDDHGPRWREIYLRTVEATLEPDVASAERARVEVHPDYQGDR